MRYTFTEQDVEILCTFEELVEMDFLNLAIWGTPNGEGNAVTLYKSMVSHRPSDFVVAQVEDFCKEQGWYSLGWEEMTREEVEEIGNETYGVVVGRRGKIWE